jgi:hypothetical protein
LICKNIKQLTKMKVYYVVFKFKVDSTLTKLPRVFGRITLHPIDENYKEIISYW